MAKLTVMPMLGHVKYERMYSLTSCHALFESATSKRFDPQFMGAALEAAVKQTMTSDYVRDLLRLKSVGEPLKFSLVVEFEL